MKKSLLALAVLGTLAGSAVAQTNVTVYGLVDVGLIHESGRPDGQKVTELGSGIQSGSRLGFRGTEDLGGGLSAIFTIENGFQADTGTMGQGGLLYGRQAFVGLQGGFGTVKFGRQYTPVDVMLGQIDPFANLHLGKVSNLLVREYAARSDNAITYATPSFGGFNAELMYGFGEVAGDNSANRFVGGSVGYANGPLTARLVYQDRNPGSAAATATGLEHAVFGIKYNFGIATASFLYAQSEGTTGTATTLDADDASIGVSVPVGAGTIMASYTRRDDNLATNRDVNMIALGYTHALSKRTNVYTSYGNIKNRRGSAYTVGGATEGGSGSKGFAVGIRHLF
jgi:predicted porin